MGSNFCNGCNNLFRGEKSIGEHDFSNNIITNLKNQHFFNENYTSNNDIQPKFETILTNKNRAESNIINNNSNYSPEKDYKENHKKINNKAKFGENRNEINMNIIKMNTNDINGENKTIQIENISDINKNEASVNKITSNDLNINNNNNITQNDLINNDVDTNIIFNNNIINNNINNESKNNNLAKKTGLDIDINNNNNSNNDNINVPNSINNFKNNKSINSNMIFDKIDKENIEDKNAKKITNLFRKLLKAKNIAHNKLYKDLLEISSSETIKGLNTNQLTINLSPETPYIYLGTKFNDKKDGLGLEIFPKSKASYFGIFRNGKRVEAGKFKIKNDIKDYSYYGNIYGIYAWGFGWLINNKSKKYYEGTWEKSMKSGYGIEKYQDDSEYKGSFLNGKKNGIGFYQWSDNSSYEGEFKEDKFCGYGIYKFPNGSIYEGEWKNSKFNGYGEFTYPGIKKYIGYFEKDQRSGFGIEIWYKNQKAFIGFWKNNNIEGFGKLINDGKKKYGIWKQGNLEQKFINKNEFYEKIKDEKKGFLNFFKLDYYDAILNTLKQILK